MEKNSSEERFENSGFSGEEETKELLLAYQQTKDKTYKDKIIQHNLKLVWSVVNRFAERGYELDDLFQIGCIGLLKAVEKFDLERNVKFSTYAVPLIIGEIKVFLRDDGAVKVSRGIKETAYHAIKVRDELAATLGREPSIGEIAEAVGVDREEIVEALEAVQPTTSIYEPVFQKEDDEICLIDQLEEESSPWMEQIVIRDLLNFLDDLEQKVIILRFFRDLTQSEVADKLGLTQVQVSRIEKRALKNLRAVMAR